MTYDTYLSVHLDGRCHHICITIIDTFILQIHTNDAYIYDTYLSVLHYGSRHLTEPLRKVAESSMCVCMYVCVYVCMYVCMCVCVYVYVCMFVCVCVYVYMCICVYVYVCMCVCV
jgi:hypothetical protein